MPRSSVRSTGTRSVDDRVFPTPFLASDAAFDSLYATSWQQLSKRHWTPVEVAAMAARWLTEDPDVHAVLDVGSGVGKLCIVGALVTGRSFVGIEQRPRLVRAARGAAHAAGVSSHVEFVCDLVSPTILREFRSIYLFNPFAEHTFSEASRIDGTVEFSLERYHADVALIESALSRAALGQRVVTYHGFGGELPRGYIEERCEPMGTDFLQLWVKHRGPSVL